MRLSDRGLNNLKDSQIFKMRTSSRRSPRQGTRIIGWSSKRERHFIDRGVGEHSHIEKPVTRATLDNGSSRFLDSYRLYVRHEP